MSRKKQHNRTDARTAKRDRFVASKEQRPKGISPAILVGDLLLGLIIVGGVIFALTRPAPGVANAPNTPGVAVEAKAPLVTAATIGHAPYPQAVAEEGAVRFPLTTFDDYQAHYYTYMHENQPIEFFILKSKDGVVRAAFNACDVCFATKKGYRQDGDVMVCNNCGRRFPANQINIVRGGCNPSPLLRTVEGDSIAIQVEDIVSGLKYF